MDIATQQIFVKTDRAEFGRLRKSLGLCGNSRLPLLTKSVLMKKWAMSLPKIPD